MAEPSVHLIVGLGGLAGGAILGIVARWARFCTLSAFEDAFFGHDFRRLRAWALAVVVAIVATESLQQAGLIVLADAGVLAPTFSVIGWILGGLLFGIGMAYVGTCGYGALTRMGGGDLRAIIVVMVMGLSAYAVSGGILAPIRIHVVEALAIPVAWADSLRLGAVLGITTPGGEGLLAAAIAAGLAVWVLRSADFLKSWRLVVSGAAVGLVIAGGWFVTGHLGQLDPFETLRVESYSYVYPFGHTLVYLMTAPGAPLDFGLGATLGVVLGSAGVAVAKGEFRLEACDDAIELRRHLLGAVLMGVGGILAFGCTVGQGMSAAAALSVSAPIVFVSIAAGAWIGLTHVIEGSSRAALRRLFLLPPAA